MRTPLENKLLRISSLFMAILFINLGLQRLSLNYVINILLIFYGITFVVAYCFMEDCK